MGVGETKEGGGVHTSLAREGSAMRPCREGAFSCIYYLLLFFLSLVPGVLALARLLTPPRVTASSHNGRYDHCEFGTGRDLPVQWT